MSECNPTVKEWEELQKLGFAAATGWQSAFDAFQQSVQSGLITPTNQYNAAAEAMAAGLRER